MAWTTMHFATGMACSGAAFAVGCVFVRRGWRWLPLAMTAGGVWALVPDLPRFFREDFPSLPLAATLGRSDLERWLHSIGDLFFFHRMLDEQPRELALHGLVIILVLYNLSILLLMALERRSRIRAHRDDRRRDGPVPGAKHDRPSCSKVLGCGSGACESSERSLGH